MALPSIGQSRRACGTASATPFQKKSLYMSPNMCPDDSGQIVH